MSPALRTARACCVLALLVRLAGCASVPVLGNADRSATQAPSAARECRSDSGTAATGGALQTLGRLRAQLSAERRVP